MRGRETDHLSVSLFNFLPSPVSCLCRLCSSSSVPVFEPAPGGPGPGQPPPSSCTATPKLEDDKGRDTPSVFSTVDRHRTHTHTHTCSSAGSSNKRSGLCWDQPWRPLHWSAGQFSVASCSFTFTSPLHSLYGRTPHPHTPRPHIPSVDHSPVSSPSPRRPLRPSTPSPPDLSSVFRAPPSPSAAPRPLRLGTVGTDPRRPPLRNPQLLN